MKSAALGIAVAVSAGLIATPAFGAGAARKAVPVSCNAVPRQASFPPSQAPVINYRAVAPLGFGAVVGDLSIAFIANGQVVRTAQRHYLGQSLATYRFAPLPPGRYTVSMSLMTPRRSSLRNCSAFTRLAVAAARPAPVQPLSAIRR